MNNIFKEALIKSGMQIAQTDFSSDCMKMTQEYLMYFKEFSCKMAENMQARCVPRFIQCFLSSFSKSHLTNKPVLVIASTLPLFLVIVIVLMLSFFINSTISEKEKLLFKDNYAS